MENLSLDFKLNKKLAIGFSILGLFIKLSGVSILIAIMSYFRIFNIHDCDISKMLIWNLYISLFGLTDILIAFYFFFNAKKLGLDKWSWFLLGLIYGEYSLIMILLIIIAKGFITEKMHFRVIQRFILIILISIIIIKALNYFKSHFDVSVNCWDIYIGNKFFNYFAINTFVMIIPVIIFLILNIIFSIQINQLINQQKKGNKFIWIISTLILGFLPLIIFQELLIIETQKK